MFSLLRKTVTFELFVDGTKKSVLIMNSVESQGFTGPKMLSSGKILSTGREHTWIKKKYQYPI